MTDRGKNLSEILAEAAARKLRAAQTRFGKNAIPAESPREVYLKACQHIADVLAPDGFTYARSSQSLTRKTKDFSFHVYFQSDRNNVAGELVALWIHAGVRSKRLKAWRETQLRPFRTDDGIAGGQLGNLVSPPSWMEWNLANPDLRAGLLSDAVATIRQIAFSYFALFEDPHALCLRLIAEELPSMDISGAIEFLLCYGDKQVAESCLHRFLFARPDILAEYHVELEKVRRDGIPHAQSTGYAVELAYVTMAYGLEPPG